MKNTKHLYKDHPLFDESREPGWYHSIEFEPSLYTPGADHRNVAITRALLKGCDVTGQRCLDIGTQDGLVPVLLSRRGAKWVAGQDVTNKVEHIDFIKEKVGVDFEYYGGLPLKKLKETIIDNSKFPLGILIFSGVFYHMADPLAGLALARSLLRHGGLCIVETMAVLEKTDSQAMYFNYQGRLSPGNSYWAPSIKLLDYLLRMVLFIPIDFRYLGGKYYFGENQVARIAVVCRAVEQPVVVGDDEWINKQWLFDVAFREYIDLKDWEKLQTGEKDVSYKLEQPPIYHHGTDAVDLYAAIQNSDPLKVTDLENQVKLRLDANY